MELGSKARFYKCTQVYSIISGGYYFRFIKGCCVLFGEIKRIQCHAVTRGLQFGGISAVVQLARSHFTSWRSYRESGHLVRTSLAGLWWARTCKAGCCSALLIQKSVFSASAPETEDL